MNVYDFDKTILPYDSTQAFFRMLFRKYPKLWLNLPTMGIAAIKYKLGYINKTEMKNIMYQSLTQLPNLDAEVAVFWAKRRNHIQSWYLAQKQNDDVIISASPTFLLKPICELLNVRLIASQVDVHTGKHQGKNCYGSEKPVRFAKEFSLETIDAFYSDSYSDTPMAVHAKNAYLVKGTKILPWDFKKKYNSYEH